VPMTYDSQNPDVGLEIQHIVPAVCISGCQICATASFTSNDPHGRRTDFAIKINQSDHR
jgi:hypothetical protein